MITLSEEQVKQLESIINEMPTKFGVPIINILNQQPPKQEVDEGKETPTKNKA